MTTWEERLLIRLAIFTYLCSGLYLTLFATGIDFGLVYDAARRLLTGNGGLLYQEFLNFQPGQNSLFYMYPPLVAGLYTPLALLPRAWALGIFFLINQAALWDTLRMLLDDPTVSRAMGRRVVILFLLFFPLYYSFHMGQCEAIVLWCLVASLRWMRRDRWLLAGLVLAVAIYLKMFLILIPLSLLLTGRYRAAAACFVWVGLGMAVSAALVPGDVLKQWFAKISSPIGIEAFIDNQSLTGFIARSLTLNPYTRGFWNAPAAALVIEKTVGAAIGLCSAAALYRYRRTLSMEKGLAFTLITALLIAPHTDTHHLTLLLLPFSVLALSDRFDHRAATFYAFFASFIPLWAFKFLSVSRGVHLAQHAAQLIFSIPFFMLLAFWFYWFRSL